MVYNYFKVFNRLVSQTSGANNLILGGFFIFLLVLYYFTNNISYDHHN